MLVGRPYPAISHPARELWRMETDPGLHHCHLPQLVDPGCPAVFRAIFEAASVYRAGEAALGAVLDRLQHHRLLNPDSGSRRARCELAFPQPSARF
jgi:hypothetical protein